MFQQKIWSELMRFPLSTSQVNNNNFKHLVNYYALKSTIL